MKQVAIIFAMSALNIPFIVENPTRWWNWVFAGICFALGVSAFIQARRRC